MNRRFVSAFAVISIALFSAATFAGGEVLRRPRTTRSQDVRERLELAKFSPLALGDEVSIDDLPLGAAGSVSLRMERFEILAPNAQAICGGINGEAPLQPLDLVLLRGTIKGDAESQAFLGVSSLGIHGFIRRADELYFISSGVFRDEGEGDPIVRVIEAGDIANVEIGFDVPICGSTADRPELFPQGFPAQGEGGAAGGTQPCRVAWIAIDSDWEFTSDLFGGDAAASATYALTLAAAVSEIFTADLNVRFLVPFLRVWDADVDPYEQDGGDLLAQFKAHWQESQVGVERHAAHMLSGRDNLPYGGVAYLSALCSMNSGFGLSGYLNGSFPYPLEDNHSGNWDLVVVAHELGHNFGTAHTHDGYNPPIDNCGNGDCTGAEDGTIMSYCHTCSGGISNIALNFHPLVVDRILSFLDEGACDIIAGPAEAANDWVESLQMTPALVDVLLNDYLASCNPGTISIESFDAVSLRGGTLELVPADGEFERDRLLFNPPPVHGTYDFFNYTVVGGETALVTMFMHPIRSADITGQTEPGAKVDYYELTNPTVLPVFGTLTPYASDVALDVDFASTTDAFATSGRTNEVGAVFTGFVTVPENGLYTLSCESDDGSAVYVGQEIIIDNDGTHGMVEKSGDIALEAGAHEVRVEFFENTGGAGLIVRIEGPNLPKQTIPAGMWSHRVACSVDFNTDGVVDAADLAALLGSWGPCVGCPHDVNGDDVVDAADLATLLGAWGTCL